MDTGLMTTPQVCLGLQVTSGLWDHVSFLSPTPIRSGEHMSWADLGLTGTTRGPCGERPQPGCCWCGPGWGWQELPPCTQCPSAVIKPAPCCAPYTPTWDQGPEPLSLPEMLLSS